MSQELQLPVSGALVRARGECWRVTDVTRHEDCAVCLLQGTRPSNRDVRRALLLPFDRLVPAARPGPPLRVGRRPWVRAFRGRLLRATPWHGIRAGVAAHFDLLPYQMEPALACLRGETRLLIADEVGLGKTVQAGLILAEVFAREHDARALVLAPASLCPQWVAELKERFALPARHLDACALRLLACSAGPQSNPWLHVPLPVSSFDFLKQPEVLAGVADLRWDALVVDEAHMVALAPERARLSRVVAARARRVILLTATPHAADREGFRALCSLGRMQETDGPILMFRRSRSSLGLPGTRRAAVLRVRLSDAERRMHAALERYTSAVWREAPVGVERSNARLAMIVLRKRAASGPRSLEASLSRRLRLLDSMPGPAPVGQQLLLPLDDEAEDRDDEEPEAVLGAPGLRDPEAEKRTIGALLRLASAACPADSKARALERMLARTSEPAIVFTEYRDTLLRLAERLERIATLTLLHGGMDHASRRTAASDFTQGRVRLLLATDAAAHGLNLQARCRFVVDVELPWIPARLEQRIGRVDRIGQRRRVHAVHLVSAGTAEEAVLTRLVARIGREGAALGYADNPLGPAGEIEVARGVFEGWESQVRLLPAVGGGGESPVPGETRHIDLRGEATAEAARLRALRGMNDRQERRAKRRASNRESRWRPLWTVVRRRALAALPAGLVCLFAAPFADGRGCVVEEWLVAVHAAIDCLPSQRRPPVSALPSLLAARGAALQAAAASMASLRLHELRTLVPSCLAELQRREAAIAATVHREGAPLQPGLFDRRALKAAEERRLREELDAAVAAARLAALSRGTRVDLVSEPELVLVLALV